MYTAFLCIGLAASAVRADAQDARLLRAVNLTRRGVQPANYSGIAPIGGNRYALVSDKEAVAGYYPIDIELDARNGKVKRVEAHPFRPQRKGTAAAPDCGRDCEGVVYVPQSHTLFISGEGDQEVMEYTLEGMPTGRSLYIPIGLGSSKIYPNYGFEALAYDTAAGRFWTTTESTLKADGKPAGADNRVPNLLRLQSFGSDLRPEAQYTYLTDAPEALGSPALYAFGVPALTVLPDGRLLVMEREFFVTPAHVGSWVNTKLYVVDPAQGEPTAIGDTPERLREKALTKTLVASFDTHMKLINWRLANYEGMCLGPRLADGRQTVLLVSDSQGGYGKRNIRLKDYLRVVILP